MHRGIPFAPATLLLLSGCFHCPQSVNCSTSDWAGVRDTGDDEPHPDTDDTPETGDTSAPAADPTWTCANGETMSFAPSPVDAAVPLTVSITGATGYVYVDLAVTGPATANVAWQGVTGGGPYTWSYGVTGLSSGDWSMAFTADSGATPVCNATVPVTGSAPADGIAVSGTSITLDGAPFRFVGFNARGLSHYGGGDILPYTSTADIATTLDAVQAAGGTVIRVFAANHSVSDDVAADRLAALLDACEARGIYVIVALTDEYATGFSPQGDDSAYYVDGNGYSVLSPDWYSGVWREYYSGWVTTVVARNAGNRALFGWEPGNETKQPADPSAWLAWLTEVSNSIRTLDPDTPILAGTIDIGSTYLSDPAALVGVVDVMTVHLYDGATTGDLATAESLGMPVLIEETGFSSGDRADSTVTHASWAISAGADGYMQWGLMATSSDNGDGDRTYGMDRVFHDDWDELTGAYAGIAGGM